MADRRPGCSPHGKNALHQVFAPVLDVFCVRCISQPCEEGRTDCWKEQKVHANVKTHISER